MVTGRPAQFRALVLDDDPLSLGYVVEVLTEGGFECLKAGSVKEARSLARQESFDALFLDLFLPDGSGLEILEELQSRSKTIVVMITAHASLETVTRARQLGAADYLTKPLEPERLATIVANVRHALEKESEIHKLRGQLRNLGQFGPLVGASPAMQQVYDQIEQVAPTDASVLIQGQSGTGKELVAQAIHEFSRRSKGPFLQVNCGAMSPTLIDSELFGHERGSFTGAERTHKGCFERANGGTLLLDEVTEMPLDAQVKLLRVLESGSALRVGGDRPIPLDVRVIAATNRDPKESVEEGKLREDILYRLNVFPLRVPLLRERGDDILLLAGAFLSTLNRDAGTAKYLSAEAARSLLSHSWPGNVRELKNRIHRAYIRGGEEISSMDLFETEAEPAEQGGPKVVLQIGTSLGEAEDRLIDATLAHCGGDRKRAAGMLQISLRTLYYRLNSRKADKTKPA